MSRFVDRKQELIQLARLAGENRPHLLVVCGRRRLGKTTLLLEFASQSDLPALYWVASKECRRSASLPVRDDGGFFGNAASARNACAN
jgi:hypothetical protein